MQKTSTFLIGIRRQFRDSGAQQHWPGNKDTFRKIGELVRKKTVHGSRHRRKPLHYLLEQRSEVHRNQHCEHFSAGGKRVWQSSALVSPTNTLNTDLAPIGDDIDPIEAPRDDVEMGNDEDEEPLEAGGSQSKNESQ